MSAEVVIINGDCLSVTPTLTGIDIVITDPPYGIDANGEMLGQLSTGHRRQGMYAYGGTHSRGFADNDPAVYTKWCNTWAADLLDILPPGAFVIAFAAPRTVASMATGFTDAGLHVRDIVAWIHGGTPNRGAKLSPGLTTTLSQKWEPIIVARTPFSTPTMTATDNYLVNGTGAVATRYNVFQHPKAPTRERPVLPDGTKHPSVKPLALMSEIIETFCTRSNLTILDPFAGSGTTGQAAVLAGHNVVLIEKSPVYVELIKKRLNISDADPS